MSARMPWLKLTTVTVGIMGLGYLLMRTTVPTPEQTYNALSPDLRRKVDANRQARLALQHGTQRQQSAQLEDPDAAKPLWADQPTKPR